jgi:phosphatidylserine/phosphatidylglycerophosphate/cardiolipin synthase-like enzyme
VRVAVALVVVLLAATAPLVGGASATGTVTIEAVYPNPIAPDDAGEFVVLAVPNDTDLSTLTLSDGERRVRLPEATVSGRVALSAHPERVRPRTDLPVLALDRRLRLSNAGETVTLARAGRIVATLSYDRAPEGEVYDGEAWEPLGATDLPVVHTGPGEAQVFVLPDAPGPPIEPILVADERVLLAGYTFASARVRRALVNASERGATVRVLVEGGPVGGISRREARELDRLSRAGVEVRVVAEPYARYAFHHPKYVVADGRAVVLTENWKPAGTGGHSSRGWGVVLSDPEAVAALTRTFHADAGWHDTVTWEAFRAGRSFEPDEPANATFPARFVPEAVRVENASVLVAPENAEGGVLRRLDAADTSIRVIQPTVGGSRQPFVRALVRAAKREVRVRLLLGGAWYVEDENRALAARLNERAAENGWALQVRIADPRGRYEKVHAKGVVIDRETALVGSLNWNNNSARENREVVVALESEGAARYYARVFDADWKRANARVPIGLLGAVALAALVAVWVGRRIEFEAASGVGADAPAAPPDERRADARAPVGDGVERDSRDGGAGEGEVDRLEGVTGATAEDGVGRQHDDLEEDGDAEPDPGGESGLRVVDERLSNPVRRGLRGNRAPEAKATDGHVEERHHETRDASAGDERAVDTGQELGRDAPGEEERHDRDALLDDSAGAEQGDHSPAYRPVREKDTEVVSRRRG